MTELELCPCCDVPCNFVRNHSWLEGGVIVQSNDPEHRMVFIESENLDPLFRGIEEIIGVPIERIIIETKRRGSREYVSRLLPPEIKEGVLRKEVDLEPLIESLNVVSSLLGYGKTDLVDYRYERDERDFFTERMEYPYSVPLMCGDFTGSTEAVTEKDFSVTYRWISGHAIEVTCRPHEHPPEFRERLQFKSPPYKKEGAVLEDCRECGGPVDLSAFRWLPEKGMIVNQATGRRFSMFGPQYLEAVFDELERELGETIPRVVVEAQRRFSKTGFYDASGIGDVERIRKAMALRGLGYVHELRLEKKRLTMEVHNVALPLMIVGLMQGGFELLAGSDSEADWEISPEGTLRLAITAKEG